jgi:hypoxanthine phosphoribosyltransferase
MLIVLMVELKVTTEQFPLTVPELLKLQNEMHEDTLVVPLRNGGAQWYHRYLDRYLGKLLPQHRVQELEIHSYNSDKQQKTLTVELSELSKKQNVGSIVLVDDIVDSGLTMKVAGTVMQHFYPNVPITGLAWFRRSGTNNAPPFELVSLYTVEKEWVVFPWEVE